MTPRSNLSGRLSDIFDKLCHKHIIVSNDFNNYFCDLVTIIPVTTKKDNLPQHRSIMLRGRKNYILPEQITTIPKKWLKEKMCHLNDANIQEVKMSMKIQYNL